MNEIVPFGKYKGMPIEVLSSDPQYCEWLSGQDWFRERYSKCYNIIINNFTKPEDTPEHNQMQAKFLNEAYSSACLVTFFKPDEWIFKEKPSVEFEYSGFDVRVSYYVQKIANEYNRANGWINIELKPSIGDDYPSVLRQIKANKNSAKGFDPCCLVYDNFSASGISETDMRNLFIKSHVNIRSTKEIEEMLKKGEANGN